MILQHAGVRLVPWEQTLQALLQRLAPYDLRRSLIGSAALAIQGIECTPGDLDLVVNGTGALQLGEIYGIP